jgi:Na+/melibiose symporter-like transporter
MGRFVYGLCLLLAHVAGTFLVAATNPLNVAATTTSELSSAANDPATAASGQLPTGPFAAQGAGGLNSSAPTVLNAVRHEDYRPYWATCIVICVLFCACMAWYLFVHMARVERERRAAAMLQQAYATAGGKRHPHGVC